MPIVPARRVAPAVVLLAHGSPDPDWSAPLRQVLMAMRTQAPDRAVELAFVDHIAPSLETCVRDLIAKEHQDIVVIAAFLSAGGKHLKRDIPVLVATLAAELGQVSLRLLPGALGDDPMVIEALADAALRRAP